jgi:glutaredoxin
VVTLYTRHGCHLCERAGLIVDEARRRMPFELEVVDIDQSPALKQKYNEEVPVIAIDGRDRFGYAIELEAFLHVLEHRY